MPKKLKTNPDPLRRWYSNLSSPVQNHAFQSLVLIYLKCGQDPKTILVQEGVEGRGRGGAPGPRSSGLPGACHGCGQPGHWPNFDPSSGSYHAVMTVSSGCGVLWEN